MRGKLFVKCVHIVRWGLIPAHAGKTTRALNQRRAPPAHPRACGENAAGTWVGLAIEGSSPRMRGKQSIRKPAIRHVAHPRACGENGVIACACLLRLGSSPRMRGKRSGDRRQRMLKRLIPAHAGKTWCNTIRSGESPAHPRACGENPNIGRAGSQHAGSSPRMRGKR